MSELISCCAEVFETTEINPYIRREYDCEYIQRMDVYCSESRCPLGNVESSWGFGEDTEEASINAYKKTISIIEKNCVGNKTPKFWSTGSLKDW